MAAFYSALNAPTDTKTTAAPAINPKAFQKGETMKKRKDDPGKLNPVLSTEAIAKSYAGSEANCASATLAKPQFPIPHDLFEGIQFHRKTDREALESRIQAAIDRASAITRINAEVAQDQ